MSDPLSVAAGVVALVTFGVQASSSLLQLIKDFKRAPSTVRTLKEELEALVAVLQALKATIEDTESDFTPLKTPLYQCSKACHDFEAILSHFAGRTHSAKTSFQDWTKLKYLGSDIHGFKDMIAGYKATISIAICNVNLRSSALTLGAFNEYKDMIANTTYDLENRLRDIDAKLQIVVSRSADGTEESPIVREQMQEEKNSILKCLEICDNVSEHITVLQRKTPRNVSTSSSSHERAESTNRPAVSAWLAAANNLTGCRGQLETHLQRLSDKSKQPSDEFDPEATQAKKDDLLREINSLQRSIDICDDAYKEADRNRTNVFEEVLMGDDGRQVIASTVGDLIFARKIKIGSRSVQMLGQMSDLTIQHATSNRDVVVSKESQQRPEVRGEDFEGRYGAGRDLRPQTSPKLN
ncbi:hypothetical protein ABVK25_012494 [Lepraria finkii]|uniref:Azaphilone pigments biosynthesis cluster protein L N-terminal domain-containing protein n=1 Tax=Lepraria finkii TaxID=1340010 RepID=A0ABR4AE22_9LECA